MTRRVLAACVSELKAEQWDPLADLKAITDSFNMQLRNPGSVHLNHILCGRRKSSKDLRMLITLSLSPLRLLSLRHLQVSL